MDVGVMEKVFDLGQNLFGVSGVLTEELQLLLVEHHDVL